LFGVAFVLESSLKSSAYFDLSHGAFYDADSQLLEDLEAKKPVLQTKAILRHFPVLSLVCDFCFLMAAFALSPLSFGTFLKAPSSFNAVLIGIFLTVFSLVIFYLGKLYRIETIANFRFFCARFALILSSVVAAGEIENFMISSGTSHAAAYDRAFFIWAGLTLGLFLALRFLISEVFRFLAAQGHASHNVVVIGTSSVAAGFISKLHGSGLGVRVRAVFEENFSADRSLAVAGVAVKGGVPALLQFTKHHAIDTVVIASESPISFNLKVLVEQISVQPLRIAILPPQLLGRGQAKNMRFALCAPAGTIPGVNLVHLADIPIRGLGSFMKSAMDVTVALGALLLFGPLMLICAAGIKMASPGPVFFKQRRIGYRNKEFWIFKFRTMQVADCNTGILTKRNDPRVFKFGEIMRKFSLDELPQLFNVLKGDMSLVGPRPHIQEARAAGVLYFKAVPNYPARHRVKPGITGHAQINGWRGPTETIEQIENRVAHDLHYVENWSFLGDIKILIKTVFVGFVGDNAF
jgi:Undecaprenyl-phosphate glucose phosphotransferase